MLSMGFIDNFGQRKIVFYRWVKVLELKFSIRKMFCLMAVADLGKGPGEPVPPCLILGNERLITEERKTGRAGKTKPPPPLQLKVWNCHWMVKPGGQNHLSDGQFAWCPVLNEALAIPLIMIYLVDNVVYLVNIPGHYV